MTSPSRFKLPLKEYLKSMLIPFDAKLLKEEVADFTLKFSIKVLCKNE
jgi:hypothetical protein